jgi:bacterioferritin
MKGDDKLIETLNDLLADELTAISQYMVHAELTSLWGYGKLHTSIEGKALDEMRHAEALIERILFLEGTPVVSNLKQMYIGKTVPEIVEFDGKAEAEAIKAYNAGIAQASDAGDESTADLLTDILKDEEGHLDWAEKQQVQIDQVGLSYFLAQQIGGEEEEE